MASQDSLLNIPALQLDDITGSASILEEDPKLAELKRVVLVLKKSILHPKVPKANPQAVLEALQDSASAISAQLQQLSSPTTTQDIGSWKIKELFALLYTTGMGKVVNKLRKYPHSRHVVALAKHLFHIWKQAAMPAVTHAAPSTSTGAPPTKALMCLLPVQPLPLCMLWSTVKQMQKNLFWFLHLHQLHYHHVSTRQGMPQWHPHPHAQEDMPHSVKKLIMCQ
ncbi:hypothetical protein GOP47_0005780 [Adiantum capillus-veneris]|uniref:TFIIS N-terminal domain-containing protein n=1 Tax=Adiantum capillus-veneris TaxID=13818 RepID=A0A9D4V6P3_ADICA|nr:hypothetical protein GOP47_0005780 [Adiantum capillus-veneris]